MFYFEDVKQLLEQADGNTLALYLNVDARAPENVTSKPGWRIWVKDALRALTEEISPEHEPVWADIRSRAEQFFDGYQPQGKGIAFLMGPSFERHFEFPFPMDNHINYGKPNVMPLLWALDEYEPYLIVIVDQEKAHFLTATLGRVIHEESAALNLDTEDWPRKTTKTTSGAVDKMAQRNARDTFEKRIDQYVERFYEEVAERAAALVATHQARRVILGGSEESAHAVRSLLSEPLAATATVLPIPMRYNSQEVLDHVAPIALDSERQEEINLVQEVIGLAKSGGRGALGWEAVRQALQMQRVELLILPWPLVDENQAADLTLKAFASGGKIELVHGEAAQLLGGEGGLAARLYYAL